MNRLIAAIVALVIIGYLLISSIFVVDERDQAIVTRFGEITREVQEPGLYFKLPTSLIDNVQYVPKRLLRYDLERIRLQVSGGQFYIVDAFLTYRIVDLTAYRQGVQADIRRAEAQIATQLESALRTVYGLREFDAALSEQRPEMMREARDLVTAGLDSLGIEVVDVRVLVTELTPEVLTQTYQRMQAEREAEAALIRARGEEQARILRAIADRQVVEIISAANRDAQIIMGEGDAERNRILAAAYGPDPDFFEFYRSLEAYQTGLDADSTSMVLDPDTAFFRYFGANSEGLPEFAAPAATPINIGVEGPSENPVDSSEIDDLLATDTMVSGDSEGADSDLEGQVDDLQTLVDSENLGAEGDGDTAPETDAPADAETTPAQ